MRVLKHFFDFYLNSSIHVALAVYSLSWITLKSFNIQYDENVLYFIFFATITGYNFVKFFGIAKWHHRSLSTWLKVIQIFSLLCFVLMCFYGLKLKTEVIFYILGFGLVTFLYAIPFLPKRFYMDRQQNLRNISGLKVYVIALVWAGVTVVLPILNNDYHLNADVVITTLQRFVFVIALMLPFEIRDLSYDSLKLATIPQKIGVKQTKIIGVLLLMLFFFLEFFKDNLQANSILILVIVLMITLLFVIFSKKERSRYYSAFWVESVPIMWLLLILFSEFFF